MLISAEAVRDRKDEIRREVTAINELRRFRRSAGAASVASCLSDQLRCAVATGVHLVAAAVGRYRNGAQSR